MVPTSPYYVWALKVVNHYYEALTPPPLLPPSPPRNMRREGPPYRAWLARRVGARA